MTNFELMKGAIGKLASNYQNSQQYLSYASLQAKIGEFLGAMHAMSKNPIIMKHPVQNIKIKQRHYSSLFITETINLIWVSLPLGALASAFFGYMWLYRLDPPADAALAEQYFAAVKLTCLTNVVG